MKVNPKEFGYFLSCACLNKHINEAVLFIENGKACIQATNPSNSIVACVSCPVDSQEENKYGIADLNQLSKYFSMVKDKDAVEIKEQEGKLIFISGNNKFKISLIDIKMVATVIKEYVDNTLLDSFLDNTTCVITSIEKERSEIMNYFTLVDAGEFALSVQDKKVKFIGIAGGTEFEYEFETQVESPDFETFYFTKHLKEIFAKVSFDADVEFHFGKDVPLVIVNGTDYWAIVPLGD